MPKWTGQRVLQPGAGRQRWARAALCLAALCLGPLGPAACAGGADSSQHDGDLDAGDSVATQSAARGGDPSDTGDAGAAGNGVERVGAGGGDGSSGMAASSAGRDDPTQSADEESGADGEASAEDASGAGNGDSSSSDGDTPSADEQSGADDEQSGGDAGGAGDGENVDDEQSAADDGAGGGGQASGSAIDNPVDIAAELPDLPAVECELDNPCVIGSCAADTNPCEGDYSIASAAELDTIRDCTSISGDLSISRTELTTLAPLALVAVGGELHIQSNALLASYDGLSNLTSVGSFYWYGNGYDAPSGATDLRALSNLRYVESDFTLRYPYHLTSLEGLSLKAIGGKLAIERASEVADLSPLASLQCAGRVVIDGMDELTSLRGLENLEQLGGLGIGECSKLADLSAVSHLTTLPAGLGLGSLPLITDLSAFSGLESVGPLSLDSMRLENLMGLSSLKTVAGRFTLHRNSSLSSVEGVSSLEIIGGEFLISGDNGFVDFRGMETLRIVGEDITLDAAHHVESYEGLSGVVAIGGTPEHPDNGGFEGLSSLISVGEDLRVPAGTSIADLSELQYVARNLRFEGDQEFSALTSLRTVGNLSINETTAVADLQAFDAVVVTGTLELIDNTGLVSLDGLLHDGLTGLVLKDNGALTDLSALRGVTELSGLFVEGAGPLDLTGLEDLRTITETLSIERSTLVSLDGLDGLTSLGELWIAENPTLERIDALGAVTALGAEGGWGGVIIRNNPRLPECAAQQFVDRFIADGTLDEFSQYTSENDYDGVCP